MNEDATPTFHITPSDMYPAVMESLVKLHDRVAALSKDVSALRGLLEPRVTSLEKSRIIIAVACATFVVGLALITYFRAHGNVS